MAHYAKINNGIVEQVIVAEASFFDTFVDNTPGEWIQTSFTGSIRKQFAGVGYTYDKAKDIFIEAQPHASWTLNATNDWQAPVAYPDDGKVYNWDESSTNWVEVV
jgi:hypothetical protein